MAGTHINNTPPPRNPTPHQRALRPFTLKCSSPPQLCHAFNYSKVSHLRTSTWTTVPLLRLIIVCGRLWQAEQESRNRVSRGFAFVSFSFRRSGLGIQVNFPHNSNGFNWNSLYLLFVPHLSSAGLNLFPEAKGNVLQQLLLLHLLRRFRFRLSLPVVYH